MRASSNRSDAVASSSTSIEQPKRTARPHGCGRARVGSLVQQPRVLLCAGAPEPKSPKSRYAIIDSPPCQPSAHGSLDAIDCVERNIPCPPAARTRTRHSIWARRSNVVICCGLLQGVQPEATLYHCSIMRSRRLPPAVRVASPKPSELALAGRPCSQIEVMR